MALITSSTTSGPYVQWSSYVPETTPMQHSSRRALERERARIDRQLSAFERYGDDVYEFGCALAFAKTFDDGKTYEYIVLKAPNGRWYPTGRVRADMTWSQLVDFMAGGNHPVVDVFVVSSYERIEFE